MKNLLNKYPIVLSIVVGMLLMTPFQNCGNNKGFKAASTNINISSQSPNPTPEPTPTTPDPTPTLPDPTPTTPTPQPNTGFGGQIDVNCMTNPNFDACLYWKNPVAQTNTILNATNVMSSLTPAQTFAVEILNTDGSGYLKNSAFTVLGPSGTNTDALTQRSGSWKYAVEENGSRYVAQLAAYFWLDQATQFYENYPVNSSAYIRNQNLKIYPYVPTITNSTTGQTSANNNAFFSPPQAGSSMTGIFMGVGLQNMPLALSADIMVHEFSHANVYYGSGGSSTYINPSTYANCLEAYKSQISAADYQKFNNKCCATQSGCMRAMDEAIADFHAGILFEAKPSVGEAFANNVNGLTTCGTRNTIYRDMTKNKALTVTSVFNNCTVGTSGGSSVPLPGEQYTMSAVYSSLLWEIRKNMKTAIPAVVYGGKTVDGAKIFEYIMYETASTLSGSDTFATSRLKLVATANMVKTQLGLTADLAGIINTEFARRGI